MRCKIKYPHKRNKLSAEYSESAYIFLSPVILWFLIFTFFPIGFALYLSLHRWFAISPERPFIGLQNYEKLISDGMFLLCFKNTFRYVIMYVPLAVLVSLGVALILNAIGRLKSFLRTAYFIPVVTSIVAASIIWKWLYQPTFGLFNTILSLLHLPKQSWLTSPNQALFSIVIMSVWKNLGFNMVIFLAGLQGISETYYEAARIDGANRRHCLWYITLPLLKPTTTFVLIMTVLGAFQIFVEPYIMTDPPGSPLNSTRVLVLHIYEVAFRWLRMSYGASMAFVLFGIMLIFTVLQLKFLRAGERIL